MAAVSSAVPDCAARYLQAKHFSINFASRACRDVQKAAVQGIFQGAADFTYLAGGMALACTVSAGVMLQGEGSLQQVWLALLCLQLVRAVTIALRYWDVVPVFGGSPLAALHGK
jgi:hypothetical protein